MGICLFNISFAKSDQTFQLFYGRGYIYFFDPRPYALCAMPYALCTTLYALCTTRYALCASGRLYHDDRYIIVLGSAAGEFIDLVLDLFQQVFGRLRG